MSYEVSVTSVPVWPQEPDATCRVYWGSHGCSLERGHDGPHRCSCAYDEAGALQDYVGHDSDGEYLVAGREPYYGPDTNFFGEDFDVPQ